MVNYWLIKGFWKFNKLIKNNQDNLISLCNLMTLISIIYII